MASALLSRRAHTPPPAVTLWDDVRLPLTRVHELCGRARRTLALRIAAATGGPVFWIAPSWGADPLNPCGMSGLLDPGQVTFLSPGRVEEMLWCMEECLRSGAVSVVIADITDPPGMTQVRRLHLAAETGAGAGLYRPIGLLLSAGSGGAPGIETRWQMDPAHTPERTAWRLERIRARMAPPCTWRLEDSRLSPWQPTRPAAPDLPRP